MRGLRSSVLASAAAATAAWLSLVAPAEAVKPGANGRYACSIYSHGAPASGIEVFDPAVAGSRERLPGTTGDAYDNSPSWSPDGRQLAHVGDPDGWESGPLPVDIFVYDVGTRARRNLTRTPGASEQWPAWSPDGSRIAYSTSSPGDPSAQVMVMGSDGRDRRSLGQGSEPAWSPDGRRLAFSRSGEIYTMAAAGGDVRRVTYDADEDTHPSWSPDGSRLAWTSPSPGSGDNVWVANASDGGNVRRLTYAGGSHPVWSPDGTQVAFSREGAAGYGEVWSLTLATGEERMLIDFCGDGDWARVNRPPSAGFTYAPDPPVSGQTLQLRSTSSDPDGPLASQAWDTDGDGFDDGSGATASRVLRPGERSVRIRLRVRDADGAEAVSEQTVAVGNRRPAASFTTSNAAPRVGETAVFTSTSSDPDGPLAALAWDLDGDGAFDDGNGPSAQRTFAFAGVHIVRLQVTDADGVVDVATLRLEVSAAAGSTGVPISPPAPVPAGPSLAPLLPAPPAGPPAAPGAGAPGAPSTPPVASRRPARFALSVPSRATARGNAVAVKVTCAAACRGSVRIETRAGRARGTVAFRLAAGTSTVRVPVSRSTIRLAKRRPVKLRAVATLDQGPSRTTTRRNFTLRAR
jgi:dipeptidyl aminopeptidase/acylaminoacyl peptidase